MKEHTRKKLQLVSSLTLAVLSLFSAVTLTFSWFAHNRDVGGGGMGITVAGGTGESYEYTFYRIDTSDTAGGYLFSETERESAKLGTYDVLRQSYQLLLKIYVPDTANALTVTAATDTAYFLGNPNRNYPLLGADPTNPALPDDADSTYTNALSSVVGMNFLSPDTLTKETTDGKTSYRISSIEENNLQTFIDKKTINEQTVPKNFTVTAGEAVLSDGEISPKGKSCKAVYLLITYDPALISAVFSANIGNPAIENAGDAATVIPFRSDFRLLLGVTDAG